MEACFRFYRHARLSFRALFSMLDVKVYIMVMVIAPRCQLLFFGLLDNYVYHGHGLSGFVASNALLLCVMNAVFGILTVVMSDRNMGTLQLVIASPANKLSIFLSRSVFHVLDGLATSVLGLAFGIAVFHLHIPLHTCLSLTAVWGVSIFSACGIGLLIACFGLWSPSMHLWSNLLANLLLVFSGANYVHGAMPTLMAWVAKVMPLCRGVALTKQIVDDADYTQFTSLLSQEFALGLAYFVLGLLLIRQAERAARKNGSLEFD